MEKLLNAKEVADILGVSRQTVYNWRKKGLPCVVVNNIPYYRSSEVSEWLNGQSLANKIKG